MAFSCCLDTNAGSITPCLPHFLPARLSGRLPAYLGHSNTDDGLYAVYNMTDLINFILFSTTIAFMFICYKLSGFYIN